MAAPQEMVIVVKLGDHVSPVLTTVFNNIEKFRNKIGSAFESVKSVVFSLQGAIAGLGIGLLANQFVAAASEAEGYRIRLNILLGSVAEGNKLFASMAEYAGKVTFEYKDVMGAAANLAGVMEGGVEEITKWIPFIGDVAAAANLDIQTTTQQIIRMYSAGAAAADLFRDRGTLAMLGFQQGVSVSAAETRKKLLALMDDPASKVKGAAQALANTWGGIMSMMSDQWFIFRTNVMDAGLFSYIKALANAWVEFIDALKARGEYEGFLKGISDAIIGGIEIIIKGAYLVKDAFNGWLIIWNVVKSAFASMTLFIAEGLDNVVGWLRNVILWYLKVLEVQQRVFELASLTWLALDTQAGIDKLNGILDALGGASGYSGQMKEYWEGILKDADGTLKSILSQPSGYEQSLLMIAKLRLEAEKYQAAMSEETGKGRAPKPPPVASQETLMKSAAARGSAVIQTQLAELDIAFAKREMDAVAYYQTKRDLMTKQFEAEVGSLRALQKIETENKNMDKATTLGDQIFTKEQKHKQEMIKLTQAQSKAELSAASAHLAAITQTTTKELEIAFDRRQIDVEAYYTRRRELITAEMEAKLAAATTDEAAFEIEEGHRRQLIELAEEQRKKIIELADAQKQITSTIQDIKLRVSVAGDKGGDNLGAAFAKEIADLQTKHDQELEKLRDLKASEAEIEDAHRQQQLEKDAVLADQRRRLMDTILTKQKQAFDFIQQGFSDLYEVSGKKIKEFFYVQKAAAIASAMISTYQSAVSAYASTVGIPYVGPYLAPVMAAAAIAAGMGNIAKIAQTSMAEGGEVPGYSPHSRADNIRINATAGEYMQPVPAVQYYGLPVMEGIRQKKIPREIFSGLSLPSVSLPRFSPGYASGGSIGKGSTIDDTGEKKDQQNLTINNLIDPALFSQYIASTPGQRQLLNFINGNAFEVKQILFAR